MIDREHIIAEFSQAATLIFEASARLSLRTLNAEPRDEDDVELAESLFDVATHLHATACEIAQSERREHSAVTRRATSNEAAKGGFT